MLLDDLQKILLTAKNSNNNWNLFCCGIELYGELNLDPTFKSFDENLILENNIVTLSTANTYYLNIFNSKFIIQNNKQLQIDNKNASNNYIDSKYFWKESLCKGDEINIFNNKDNKWYKGIITNKLLFKYKPSNNCGIYGFHNILSLKSKCFRNIENYNYSYSANSGMKMSQWKLADYGDAYKSGDIVKIKLDLIKREISFYRNNINQGVAFKVKCGNDINYRFAISQLYKGNSITMINLKIYGINDIKSLNNIDTKLEKFNDIEDFFSIVGNYANLSNDKKTVTKNSYTGEWKNATYGNIIIPSISKCICIWTIKVNDGTTNNMGITSGEPLLYKACFRSKDDYNYSYSAYGGMKM